MVFVHDRGQGHPWGGLVVLWYPYYFLALYDDYMEAIDVFCYADVLCDNWKVPGWLFLTAYFKVCVDCHPPSFCSILASPAPLVSCL